MYLDFSATEPELLSAKKMKKTSVNKNFDHSRVIFVHYQFENGYNHMLKKLISLFTYIPSTIQMIIITLEPEASMCNQHFAEQFQRLMHFKHLVKTLVVFIRKEDKEKIIQKLFTGRGSEYR